MKRSICDGAVNRRNFLSGCAWACAGCAAAKGLVSPSLLWAGEPLGRKPKIRLIFCEKPVDVPGWPNVGYDFATRRQQILELLTKGCPDVEFLVARMVDDRRHTAKILQADAEVDGYLIYLSGLPWKLDLVKMASTGKPTLIVDNLFGGSGRLLSSLPKVMVSGKPADWVSSSNDQDIVASARYFAMLASGRSAAEVAEAFRATRRERTSTDREGPVKEDTVIGPNMDTTLATLRDKKILVVGRRVNETFRKAVQNVFGPSLVPISFKEIAAAYDTTDRKQGSKMADRWMDSAKEIVEPTREEIEKSGTMYVAMKNLIDKHGASGISINCLGGFYGGHLKAYPCLGFRQLNDDGLVGGCEADQFSALTMTVFGSMVGRPGFISDPVMDTSKNQIIYAHCVAPTKPFGPAGPSSPFRIRSHSEDRKGAAIQSLLPADYLATTLQIDPVARKVLFHQARTAGNNPSDMACRTKLEGVVQGDIEKLTENWRMGWHRVTFYGDLRPHAKALCDRLKLKLVEEA